MLAGANNSYGNTSIYLAIGSFNIFWWTESPAYFDWGALNIRYGVQMYRNGVNSPSGVRPSISLKNNVVVTSGEGTVDNPFRID